MLIRHVTYMYCNRLVTLGVWRWGVRLHAFHGECLMLSNFCYAVLPNNVYTLVVENISFFRKFLSLFLSVFHHVMLPSVPSFLNMTVDSCFMLKCLLDMWLSSFLVRVMSGLSFIVVVVTSKLQNTSFQGPRVDLMFLSLNIIILEDTYVTQLNIDIYSVVFAYIRLHLHFLF